MFHIPFIRICSGEVSPERADCKRVAVKAGNRSFGASHTNVLWYSHSLFSIKELSRLHPIFHTILLVDRRLPARETVKAENGKLFLLSFCPPDHLLQQNHVMQKVVFSEGKHRYSGQKRDSFGREPGRLFTGSHAVLHEGVTKHFVRVPCSALSGCQEVQRQQA